MNDEELQGPGAHIALIPTWRFSLNKRDSLLVLKALGGRLTEDEDAEAEALCDRLTLQRAQAAREMVGHLERAEKHAKEKS